MDPARLKEFLNRRNGSGNNNNNVSDNEDAPADNSSPQQTATVRGMGELVKGKIRLYRIAPYLLDDKEEWKSIMMYVEKQGVFLPGVYSPWKNGICSVSLADEETTDLTPIRAVLGDYCKVTFLRNVATQRTFISVGFSVPHNLVKEQEDMIVQELEAKAGTEFITVLFGKGWLIAGIQDPSKWESILEAKHFDVNIPTETRIESFPPADQFNDKDYVAIALYPPVRMTVVAFKKELVDWGIAVICVSKLKSEKPKDKKDAPKRCYLVYVPDNANLQLLLNCSHREMSGTAQYFTTDPADVNSEYIKQLMRNGNNGNNGSNGKKSNNNSSGNINNINNNNYNGSVSYSGTVTTTTTTSAAKGLVTPADIDAKLDSLAISVNTQFKSLETKMQTKFDLVSAKIREEFRKHEEEYKGRWEDLSNWAYQFETDVMAILNEGSPNEAQNETSGWEDEEEAEVNGSPKRKRDSEPPARNMDVQ